jgi:hypothetical protein
MPNGSELSLLSPLGCDTGSIEVEGETYYSAKVKAGLFERDGHRAPNRSALTKAQRTYVGLEPRMRVAPGRTVADPDGLDAELEWIRWLRARPEEAEAVAQDPAHHHATSACSSAANGSSIDSSSARRDARPRSGASRDHTERGRRFLVSTSLSQRTRAHNAGGFLAPRRLQGRIAGTDPVGLTPRRLSENRSRGHTAPRSEPVPPRRSR